MASSLSSVFDSDATIGALEIGALMSTSLFGVTCVQAFQYFRDSKKDSRWVKILVAAVWFLDLSHAVASCHYLYTSTVPQYGHPELLFVPPLSFDFIILINGLIGALEQTWFICRLYTFSKNVWVSGFCGILAFGRFSFTLSITAISFQRPPLPVFMNIGGGLLHPR
ncbi:hypothetical protein L218DRAFT_995680 [Marasmius fiardii PR-910]|nr:hypothetical protein L218DRAFT_995680 [Marasmius fiardii PR-910]